jgi:peptidyl-prolyl cis-trans isomerase D
MIKFIHRNKQLVGIIFLVIAFCFAVTGVGVDVLHGGSTPSSNAVTIDGQTFSYNDLERSKQNIEARYRQMFGENFEQVAQSLKINITQQAVDNLIDSAILDEAARNQGFAANDDAVRKYLLTTVFKGQNGESTYSPQAYRNLLQTIGMSAPQFEKEIQKDVSRTALFNLIRDVAVVSEKDVETRFIKQNTKYSFLAAEISPSSVMGSLPTPSELDLKKYFESHATEYELPAQVSYSYYALSPKDFEKDVQVTRQDVEFYYAENASKYSIPEQVRLRSIKLLYPKESDPAKMASVRERATAARDEALSGKPFTDLVTKYSDDLPAKLSGGDLGWVSKGAFDEKFEAAVAKTSVGSISELIETDYGFEIVKVEEKRPSRQRQLDEVRGEIEKEIKTQESPSYAANKAREIVERAKKSALSLSQSAQQSGVTVKESILLGETSDPDTTVPGLTKQVFLLPTSERLIPSVVELGDSSVVVQVKEFKDPALPSFESVREKVTAAYKNQEAKRVADSKIAELLKAVEVAGADFSKEALSRQASVSGPLTISRESMNVEKFPGFTSEMRTAVLAASKADTVLGKVYTSEKGYAVLKVTAISAPNLSDPTQGVSLSKYREDASKELAQSMTGSTLAMLKARADIEIDPKVLAQ